MKRNKHSGKQKFYEQTASYIKNQVHLLRYDCAVHLEDKNDEYFWGRLFKKFAPERKMFYITYSRSERGNRTTGVGHCLNFRHYLSENFIICIDSDNNRLLGRSNYSIENFIFQTYTYSFENHHCVPEGLDHVVKHACGYENTHIDFASFIKRYSQIIYELLIWHIYFQLTSPKEFTQFDFRQMLSIFYGNVAHNIETKVDFELRRLEKNVENKLQHFRHRYPHVSLDELKEECRSIGLVPERTYLFIRGHNIYDSIARLGRGLCEVILKEKKGKLAKQNDKIRKIYASTIPFKRAMQENIRFSSYAEISWIEEDIRNFFKDKPLITHSNKRRHR